MTRAAVWRDGVVTTLGVPAGFDQCEARGINDPSQVVGDCKDSASGIIHPMLWDGETIVDLGILTGNSSDSGMAYHINNRSEIVGVAPTAFVWRDGVMTSLAPITGFISTQPPGINNLGQIVTRYDKLTPAPVDALDLALAASGAFSTTVGEAVTYSLTITNISNVTATSVTLSDPLPDGVILNSVSTSQGSCDTSVSCNLGELASGASAEVSIVMTPTLTGSLDNVMSISANEVDINAVNDTVSRRSTVYAPPEADLSVFVSDSPDPVRRGGDLLYKAYINNYRSSGSSTTASEVQFTNWLSSKVSLKSVTPSQGSCSVSSETIHCALGDIPVYGYATVDILVTPSGNGKLENTASVQSLLPDPDISNNTATTQTQVRRK